MPDEAPVDALRAGPRPRLMAIGDSLLNGMQSFTIDDGLALRSIPALVAGALPDGLGPFQPARYPPGRPVLIDAEATLRRLPHLPGPLLLPRLGAELGGIMAAVRANALSWLGERARPREDMPAFFDNLAISGAVDGDVFDATLDQVDRRLDRMEAVVRAEANVLRWSGPFPAGDPLNDGRNWGLGDLHAAINARHLMNPSNLAGLGRLRVIDLVRLRRPRILLVCLGANHGLIAAAMDGAVEAGLAGLGRFADGWRARAEVLAALPDVEVVVVVLIPRPSQAPVMMPALRMPEPPTDAPPAEPGYHPVYTSALSFFPPHPRLERAEVRALDEAVESVRRRIRRDTGAAFRNSGKTLIFHDLAAIMAEHDVKHGMGSPVVVGGGGGARRYTNHSIAIQLRPLSPKLVRGGLCGLDNVHPTTLGYRIAARELVAQLGPVLPGLPGGGAAAEVEVTDAEDPLLTSPPWGALELLQLFYPNDPLAGRAGSAGAAPAEPGPDVLSAAVTDDARGREALRLLLRGFRRR